MGASVNVGNSCQQWEQLSAVGAAVSSGSSCQQWEQLSAVGAAVNRVVEAAVNSGLVAAVRKEQLALRGAIVLSVLKQLSAKQ